MRPLSRRRRRGPSRWICGIEVPQGPLVDKITICSCRTRLKGAIGTINRLNCKPT